MLLPQNHTHIEDQYKPEGAVVGSKSYGMINYTPTG